MPDLDKKPLTLEQDISSIPLKSDFILSLGDIEDSIPTLYSPIHQDKAVNNMHLRNWLREISFELGMIKGFFESLGENDTLQENLTCGFVAFFLGIKSDFIGFDDWLALDSIPVSLDSREFEIINIVRGCANYELTKANNFFIHEWEADRWFDQWSGIEVDWSDWINGPKIK